MTKLTKNEIDFINNIFTDKAYAPALLLRHYPELGLTERECLWLIAVINSVSAESHLLKSENLQSFLHISRNEAEAIIACFIKKGFLTAADGNIIEPAYSLTGFYKELFELSVYLQVYGEQSKRQAKAIPRQKTADCLTPQIIKQIYSFFENEKGQPLTPTEIEKINHWLIDESWPPEMLKEALQRAVLHGTCNLAYIDKILLRWQKDGIKTMEQLQTEQDNAVGKSKAPAAKKQRTAKSKHNIMTNETDYNDIYNI